jgi:hypothetical protein
MKVNEGKLDRILRVIFGVIFVYYGFMYIAPPGSQALMVVGGILVLTGMIGHCPLYSILKINTSSGICNLESGGKKKK